MYRPLMTVGELMRLLATMPARATVCVRDATGETRALDTVSTLSSDPTGAGLGISTVLLTPIEPLTLDELGCERSQRDGRA